jgi:hypothetical protein
METTMWRRNRARSALLHLRAIPRPQDRQHGLWPAWACHVGEQPRLPRGWQLIEGARSRTRRPWRQEEGGIQWQ